MNIDELKRIRKMDHICKDCGESYNIKFVSNEILNKNFVNLTTKCTDCRNGLNSRGSKIRAKEYICKRCKNNFNIKTISDKHLFERLEFHTSICSTCKKYKNCENCNKEFHHHQNITCSIECAEELKVKSFIKSQGKPHNFYKGTPSRDKWENRLLETEGIVNVFQRESVKEKIKSTMMNNWGVENCSQSKIIKRRKDITFRKTLKK